MVSNVPLPFENGKLHSLVSDAKDFVYGIGFVLRSRGDPSSAHTVIHAPFTLFPSPVLRSCFNEAVSVQTDFNILYHNIAKDADFLRECLSSVIESDDFTRQLWEISETVRKEGPQQPIILALNRSDYMIGEGEASRSPKVDPSVLGDSSTIKSVDVEVSLKQIEFNTIAASFAGLAQALSTYHKFSIDLLDLGGLSYYVPNNQAATGLAKGIVTAWRLYENKKAVVMFLVYDVERNIYDHRHLEYAIYEASGSEVKVIRRTLKQVQAQGQLTPDKRLIVDGMEVAIVYLRCGYKPSDYENDEDWNTRLMMERSKAIVCPTAAYQLAGTKKVQQVLAAPNVVERFIKDKEAVRRIRATFADQYSLDLNEDGDQNTELAIRNPRLFVLKPQREGGGNNTYGDEVRTELLRMGHSAERSSYILMKRIFPVVVRNYLVASEQSVELKDVVNELGIYGALVAKGDEVILNEQRGYLLRTKPVGTDEGGVATGYSVLDSPYLVDNWPPPMLVYYSVGQLTVGSPPRRKAECSIS